MLGSRPDCLRVNMVRAEGVEPPHLSILEPKSSASTSSATRAAQEGAAYSKDKQWSKPDGDRQPRLQSRRSTGKETPNAATAAFPGSAGLAARNSSALTRSGTGATRIADPGTAGNQPARSGHRHAGASTAGDRTADHTDLTGGVTSSPPNFVRPERSRRAESRRPCQRPSTTALRAFAQDERMWSAASGGVGPRRRLPRNR